MRMLKYLGRILLVLMFLAPSADALAKSLYSGNIKGPSRNTAARPIREMKVHNVGNYWCSTTNYGGYGDPNANYPSGEWPGGSGVYYIYDGRLWIGATIAGEPYVSIAEGSNTEWDPSDNSFFYFGSGPKSIQDSYVRFDDMTSYSGHVPIGLQVSQRGLAWSLSEFDDYVVYLLEIKNISGNTLNNVNVSWVFDNDCAAGPNGDPTDAHLDDLVDYDGWTPENGQNPFRYDWVDPLDLDGDGFDGYDYWGWPVADPRNPYNDGYSDDHYGEVPSWDPEPDGVYDEFQIYETENGPQIIGQPGTDFEGVPLTKADGSPLLGYLIPRNMSYMFDGDFPQSSVNDVGERDMATPIAGFIGTRMIYLPQLPFHTTEDDTFPRPYSHQWWNWESDPGVDREKFEYMTGTHALSAGMQFMPHPYDYGAGAPVFDYRYMITSGPYNSWQDQEVKKFVKVSGIGWGLKGLRENMDNAYTSYWTGEFGVIGDPVTPGLAEQEGFYGVAADKVVQDQHFNLPIPPVIPDLGYSAGDRSVDLYWDNSAETTLDNLLGTTDFEGYKVYRSMYSPSDWHMIAAFDNVDGDVFLKNIDGDTLNPVNMLVDIDTLDLVTGDHITYMDEEHLLLRENRELGVDYEWIKIDLPPGPAESMRHDFTDMGGDFVDLNGEVIFPDISEPVNGLQYFYSVTAYDPDKVDLGLFSIESSRSNYRKDVDGAPEAVIPRTSVAATNALDDVKVVPNPYKGTAEYESQYEDKLSFIHLPPQCKVSIFSMTGDLVDEIFHDSATSGAVYWDLISRNNQKVVSGLYIYCVETPGGDKKIDKFLIIR